MPYFEYTRPKISKHVVLSPTHPAMKREPQHKTPKTNTCAVRDHSPKRVDFWAHLTCVRLRVWCQEWVLSLDPKLTRFMRRGEPFKRKDYAYAAREELAGENNNSFGRKWRSLGGKWDFEKQLFSAEGLIKHRGYFWWFLVKYSPRLFSLNTKYLTRQNYIKRMNYHKIFMILTQNFKIFALYKTTRHLLARKRLFEKTPQIRPNS